MTDLSVYAPVDAAAKVCGNVEVRRVQAEVLRLHPLPNPSMNIHEAVNLLGRILFENNIHTCT